MTERRSYSDETKAAVMAALLAGQSVNQVADAYNIPVPTVKSWKARTQDAAVDPQKKQEMGDLITDYLREVLITMKEQVILFRDADWMKKQQAESAAVLHGVLTDKAIRILSALETNDTELPTNE